MIDPDITRNAISLDRAPGDVIDCRLLILGPVFEGIVDGVKKL